MAGHGSRKRKQSTDGKQQRPDPAKRARSREAGPSKPCLIGPHEAVLAELERKYDVAAASVISSTQINKRVMRAVEHVSPTSERPRVMLLHARTAAEACKLITVVENCKRALSADGKAWYQYNQLFDLPPDTSKRKGVAAEEATAEKDADADEDSDGDHFETMQSRFEDAILPPPSGRTPMSLRVFLSCHQIPELNSRRGVTMQSSEG